MAKEEQEIVVEDVEVVAPKDLQLVVKTPKGGWANEAQENFAQVLNSYAYKNPTKWSLKKAVLIEQLKELKDKPEKLAKIQGTKAVDGTVKIKSQSAPRGVKQG